MFDKYQGDFLFVLIRLEQLTLTGLLLKIICNGSEYLISIKVSFLSFSPD